jgi:RNA polymerase sigma factor (sigma-70 family)
VPPSSRPPFGTRVARAEIEAAYRKHGHSVLRRALRLLRSEHEAKEIVQEIFTSLVEHPEQYEGRSSILTWLYAATTHRCFNRLRDTATRARITGRDGGVLAALSEPCAPDVTLELRRLLLDLPEELAMVAIYHHLDALTYDETALVMGCSRRKVAYLVEQLRDRVNSQENARGERAR